MGWEKPTYILVHTSIVGVVLVGGILIVGMESVWWLLSVGRGEGVRNGGLVGGYMWMA